MSRTRSLVALVALGAVLAGCGGEDGVTTEAGVGTTVAPSTTSTSAPTTSMPDGPCEGAGPLGVNGLGVGSVLDPSRTAERQLFVDRGGALPPDGFTPRRPEDPVDWDGDGVEERLVFDDGAGTVSITWSTGSLVVAGVDVGHVEGREDYPHAEGAVAGDVTGDGLPDLVAFGDRTLHVLVGDGGAGGDRTLEVADIGTTAPGWSVAPFEWTDPTGTDVVPAAEGDALVVWDVDGDGVDDIALLEQLPRSTGPTVWYAGRPCSP